MSADTTCPLCGFELGAPLNTCPQCDADLSCFAVLDSLPDEVRIEGASPARLERVKRSRISGPILGAGAAFCFVVGLFLGFLLNPMGNGTDQRLSVPYPEGPSVCIKIPERPTAVQSTRDIVETDAVMEPSRTQALEPWAPLWRVFPLPVPANETRSWPLAALPLALKNQEVIDASEMAVSTDVDHMPAVEKGAHPLQGTRTEKPDASSQQARTRQVGALDSEPRTEISGTPDGDFATYETKEGETLWRIAQQVYGSGYYFPVIMEINPQIRVHDIRRGMILNLYKDPVVAEKGYRENAYFKNRKPFYRYLVRPGDTYESIALKFYGRQDMKDRITDLNVDVTLDPGMRIDIAL